MPDTNKIENYWNSEYPIYVEIPKDYWVSSHNIEYYSEENYND